MFVKDSFKDVLRFKGFFYDGFCMCCFINNIVFKLEGIEDVLRYLLFFMF